MADEVRQPPEVSQSPTQEVQQKDQSEKPVTIKQGSLIIKKFKTRQVHLINEEDSQLFDRISDWHFPAGAAPMDVIKHTFPEFCGLDNPRVDAIIKAVVGTLPYDFIMKFKYHKDDDDEKFKLHQMYREDFEMMLLQKDLIIEHEDTIDGASCYVKIITPFSVLCSEAEDQKLGIQLHQHTTASNDELSKSHQSLLQDKTAQFINGIMFGDSVERQPVARFQASKLPLFVNGNAKKVGQTKVMLDFFTSGQKALITYMYIQEQKMTRYKKKRNATVRNLISDGVYTEFFPPHDGTFRKKSDSMNERAELNRNWVSKYYAKQPFDAIRKYLGERVAFYFAWTGYYTKWLAYAAVIGAIVFLYGLSRSNDSLMGPDVIVRIFDNELTPFMAFFMSIWATMYLEFWKRRQAALAYRWDVWKFERTEVTRPEWQPYSARKSPITGKYELHQPAWLYRGKMVASLIAVLVCIAIVVFSIGAIIVYRVFINFALGGTSYSWVAPVTSALMSLVILMVLAAGYKNIAIMLTDWENHKTQTEYDDAYISKQFLFDFVNTYGTLVYIGLVKEPAGTNILGQNSWNDKCTYSSCLADLMIQLCIIFIGQKVIALFQSWAIPLVMRKYNERKDKEKAEKAQQAFREHYGMALIAAEESPVDKVEDALQDAAGAIAAAFGEVEEYDPEGVPIWVKDDQLQKTGDLNAQYDTMALQFGFMTMFITAFPLAPLFALFSNILEIRLDASSMIKTGQRVVPFRAQDIGQWGSILNAVSYIAVVMNACLIAFSSKNFAIKYLAGLSESQALVAKIAFVLVFEHTVLGLKILFQFLIPDIPVAVKRAIQREDYIARVTVEGEAPAKDDPEALLLLGIAEPKSPIGSAQV